MIVKWVRKEPKEGLLVTEIWRPPGRGVMRGL